MKYKNLNFKKLTIYNFGPYFGTNPDTNTIYFSDDLYKNVTLIEGDQGSGKTSVFQLIYWILFPSDDKNEWEQEFRFLRNKRVLNAFNSKAKRHLLQNPNETAKLGGQLDFYTVDKSNNKTEYSLSRVIEVNSENGELKFSKGSIHKSTKIEAMKNNQPLVNPDTIYERIINRFFPPSVRDFVFIYGEGLNRILSLENVGRLKNYSLNISDYPRIKTMNVYLSYCRSKFNDEIGEIDKSNEKLNKLHEQEKRLQKEITGFTYERTRVNTRLKEIVNKVQDLKQELNNIETSNEQIEKYLTATQELSKIEKQRESIIQQREQIFMKNMPALYLEDAMNSIVKDIEQKQKQGIIPGNLTKDVFDDILKRDDCCVCGTKWNNAMRKKILELKKNATSSNEGAMANQLLGQIKLKLGDIEDLKRTVYAIEVKFSGLNSKKMLVEDKVEKLRRLIDKDINDEEIKNQKDRIDAIKSEIEKGNKLTGQYEAQIRDYQNKINRKEEEIKKIQTQIKKTDTTTSKGSQRNQLVKIIAMIDLYSRIIDDIVNQVESEIREKTKEKTLQNLKKLAKDPDNWQEVEIEDSEMGWHFQAKNVSGSMIDNISTGQTNITGMAFITALSDILNINLPLIFDSPFVNLDLETRLQVSKKLPQLYEGRQVIFFLKDSELIGPEQSDGSYQELDQYLNQYVNNKFKINNPENEQACLEVVDI